MTSSELQQCARDLLELLEWKLDPRAHPLRERNWKDVMLDMAGFDGVSPHESTNEAICFVVGHAEVWVHFDLARDEYIEMRRICRVLAAEGLEADFSRHTTCAPSTTPTTIEEAPGPPASSD